MSRPAQLDSRAGITRRAVLGGGVAAILGAAGGVLNAVVGDSSGRRVRRLAIASEPGSESTTVPPIIPSTTTSIADSSPIPGVPIAPVPVRSGPVYKVHDYMPTAPPNAVALTIDDGPDPPWTPEVLAALDEHGVKATFSLVGIHVAQQPDLVRQIVAAGHGVCNHSMTHPEPFSKLPQPAIDAEIAGGLQAIYAACGQLSNVFRSPGGDWSSGMFATIAQWGMTPIDWDVDPRDWCGPGSPYIIRRMLAARPGDILLCHDGGGNRAQTAVALRTVIPSLLDRGLQFVIL